MKTRKPIIIILGEPNSVFTEILSKVLNKISIKKIKNPIIIIDLKIYMKHNSKTKDKNKLQIIKPY